MDAIGGGVLVAAAAALWIAYLLPSWLRRRQYLATERNAVRLQQTLRILAETAETPEPVRVEATAREVMTQQRILHQHEEAARLAAEAAEHLAVAERRAAEEAAIAARELAASAIPAPVTEPMQRLSMQTDASPTGHSYAAAVRARRSLRRRRGLCSLLLLASLLTAIGGAIAWVLGATPLVATGGTLGVLVAASAIAGLARVRLPVVAAEPVAERSSVPFEPIDLTEAEAETESHEWTPQPLPKPLHLSRGTIAAAAMASVEAAEQLRRTALEAEVARRAEQLEQPVPRIAPAASSGAAAAPTSPYARMGIVDDAEPGLDDLDAVLRRRRRVV
jgi:hypothetical protein